MKRRTRRTAIALGVLFVLGAAWALFELRDGAPRTPNVLLITIDTLRWDHVGAYGAGDGITPALDALAARGVRFETAIMHVPLTAPSHASILTGLTPVHHGVHDNGAYVLSPQHPSLASQFRTAGYTTAAFVSGFPLERRFGFANGFETFDDRLPRVSGSRGAEGTERRADETTRRAIEWFDARQSSGDRPWLLWVHYFDPHAAYDPPTDYARRFPDRPYDGEIAFADAQLGVLLQHVNSANTIVLATADHGESLGEHGEDTHGVFVYDSTLRVPFIIAGPGIPAGRVASGVARGVDVLPTLLDFAGLPPTPGVDGRSLRPAIEGAALEDEPAYIESLLASRNFGWAPLKGVRDARWKYIEAPTPELYDLAADPRESVNRHAQQPDRARALAAALTAASRNAAPDATTRVAEDTSNRLRSLGYVGATSPQPATGRDPKNAVALINRIERAIADVRRDPTRASEELRAVVAEDPGIVIARRQLAVALSSSGDQRGAIEQLEWLQARNAATAEDLALLSEALRVSGRGTEAADALARASRLDPASPEIPLTEARARAAERRASEAAAAYRRALELAPDNVEALAGLGQLSLASGDVAGAEMLFQRVLAIDPGDLSARTGLAVALGRRGRAEEAIPLLQGVVRDAPANAQALAALGAALARSGSAPAAVPYFQRAIDAGLRTPAVFNGLGFARLESGDYPGALAALRASLAIEPQQPAVQQAVRDLDAGRPPVR